MSFRMNHYFNISHATQYGLKEAILLNILELNNYANQANNWFEVSIDNLNSQLPYFSKSLLTKLLSKLVDQNVLERKIEKVMPRKIYYRFHENFVGNDV